ncbi:hypothetical protein ACOME3_005146 [Neoechinorhynchus agilis]
MADLKNLSQIDGFALRFNQLFNDYKNMGKIDRLIDSFQGLALNATSKIGKLIDRLNRLSINPSNHTHAQKNPIEEIDEKLGKLTISPIKIVGQTTEPCFINHVDAYKNQFEQFCDQFRSLRLDQRQSLRNDPNVLSSKLQKNQQKSAQLKSAIKNQSEHIRKISGGFSPTQKNVLRGDKVNCKGMDNGYNKTSSNFSRSVNKLANQFDLLTFENGDSARSEVRSLVNQFRRLEVIPKRASQSSISSLIDHLNHMTIGPRYALRKRFFDVIAKLRQNRKIVNAKPQVEAVNVVSVIPVEGISDRCARLLIREKVNEYLAYLSRRKERNNVKVPAKKRDFTREKEPNENMVRRRLKKGEGIEIYDLQSPRYERKVKVRPYTKGFCTTEDRKVQPRKFAPLQQTFFSRAKSNILSCFQRIFRATKIVESILSITNVIYDAIAS